MSDRQRRKEIVTDMVPETAFWISIVLMLGILLATGFLF